MNRLYDRIYSPDYLWTNIPVNVRLPNEDALHSSKLREELSGPLTIIKTCVMCGTTHEIRVKTADYRRWRQGAYIQDAMPYLTANEREILMSGICRTCFDALYPEEEELVLT
mgnify:CR=1 FL=1